ncbi:MAG: ribonuclease HI family protein, partial [Thermodesulfobacteriota bacterium]
MSNLSNPVNIYVDGASRGNPGDSGIGILFKDNNDNNKEFKKYIGVGTNNNAEYTALITALEIAKSENLEEINIYTDSQLVANQVNGTWKVKDSDIKLLFNKTKDLISNFPHFTITHIRREYNSEADRLANEA